MEKMLAGLSSRRYGHGLEPAGQAVESTAASTSKSAMSRRFVAATETALAELMTRWRDDLDLVALMIDGCTSASTPAWSRWASASAGPSTPRRGGGLPRERHPGHRPGHRAARPRPGRHSARPRGHGRRQSADQGRQGRVRQAADPALPAAQDQKREGQAARTAP